EVGVEDAAAKLTVGDRLKPDLFLHRHRLADVVFLETLQVAGRDAARLMIGAGLQQLGRSQKGADVIGTERWVGGGGALHDDLLRRSRIPGKDRVVWRI